MRFQKAPVSLLAASGALALLAHTPAGATSPAVGSEPATTEEFSANRLTATNLPTSLRARVQGSFNPNWPVRVRCIAAGRAFKDGSGSTREMYQLSRIDNCTVSSGASIETLIVSGDNYKWNDAQTDRSRVTRYHEGNHFPHRSVAAGRAHLCGTDCVRYNSADFFFQLFAHAPQANSVLEQCPRRYQATVSSGANAHSACGGGRAYNDNNGFSTFWPPP